MKVIFRTDASFEIGTGHVMRCLTLANALRRHGIKCSFICREHLGNALELIHTQGFEAMVLQGQEEVQKQAEVNGYSLAHSKWLGTDWCIDAEQTIECAGGMIDWLIVDHYAIDVRWESVLRSHCSKIMVIDDLADRPHDCDLLLDQNLVAQMDRRYDGKVPSYCGRMLGPDYALLQPQYAELHPLVPPRQGAVRRVLVYFGGADTDNLTSMVIAAFQTLALEDVTLDVVINSSSPHARSIRSQVHGRWNIILYYDLPTLAPLMAQADLAIGAGGATSWERCCLGLPALVITLAENQKAVAEELDRQGLIRWLGHKAEVSEAIFARALEDVYYTGLKLEWSARCKQLVDGQGAERVDTIFRSI